MIHPEPCSLCGKTLPPGMANYWDDTGNYRLCHGDDDPSPTCYERWVTGERVGNR